MIEQSIFEETSMLFLAPIRPFLDDASVSEIMINGPFCVYVERGGKIEKTDARFSDSEALMAALRNVAQFVGKEADERHPVLEARLPDGSRFQAVLAKASPLGPCVSIRRFSRSTLTLERLVGAGALTEDAVQTLRALVLGKLNVLISGGTGSGKTSLLNALSGCADPSERIVVLEEVKEVQLQHPHVLYFETVPADARGEDGVTIGDLFRATLRMRPDRIVVGEIRGGEALDITQAMVSGHGGCMATLHASYPKDALTRLETMSMMSKVDMPLSAMRMQIGSGVNLIVQVSRLSDGSRCITHITEVCGYDRDKETYALSDIFVREWQGMTVDRKVQSKLVPTGCLPSCLPRLQAEGLDLPEAIYSAHAKRTAKSHAA